MRLQPARRFRGGNGGDDWDRAASAVATSPFIASSRRGSSSSSATAPPSTTATAASVRLYRLVLRHPAEMGLLAFGACLLLVASAYAAAFLLVSPSSPASPHLPLLAAAEIGPAAPVLACSSSSSPLARAASTAVERYWWLSDRVAGHRRPAGPEARSSSPSSPSPLLRRHGIEVRSYPNGGGRQRHDGTRRRTVISLTATPSEMGRLKVLVGQLLRHKPYLPAFDAVHLNIPHTSTRFPEQEYPSTEELLRTFWDCRLIVNRMEDYGPTTRYIGPLEFERNPETSIVVLDLDSQGMDWQVMSLLQYRSKRRRDVDDVPPIRDLVQLVRHGNRLDEGALWCFQGEDFVVEEGTGQVHPAWDTFELNQEPEDAASNISWNLVHFCRATSGVLYKPKHFTNFWFNQTKYHDSCYWDDDRWIGFQMERMDVPRKVLHVPGPTIQLPQKTSPVSWLLGTLFLDHQRSVRRGSSTASLRRRLGGAGLTLLNNQLNSHQTCTEAWLKHHPQSFPTARKITATVS